MFIQVIYNSIQRMLGKESSLTELDQPVTDKQQSKTQDTDQDTSVLYKNKSMPKKKIYRLQISICETEVKNFIKSIKEKFTDSTIEVTEDQENEFVISVEGKSIEDPSYKVGITLFSEGKNSTIIETEMNFSPYYKRVFKLGFFGIFAVFIVLTFSVGALGFQNLLSLEYLLGSFGLFGISFLVLGFFVWNRSLAFHLSALEALYWRLDSLEKDFIDQALEKFRDTYLPVEPKLELDTCHQCSTPVPANRAPGELLCESCRNLFLTCSVCLLNINHGDSIILCPHCKSPAHRDHLLEWLKIKYYCPFCKQKIDVGELEETN